jgi:nucleoside-diphosphate-sugar epimerase
VSIKPRAIVLTGGTGFLGFNLANRINSQGKFKLICLVRENSLKNKKLNELPGIISIEKVLDLIALSREYQIEHIVHSATDYGRSLKLTNNSMENDQFNNLLKANLVLPIELLQIGEQLRICSFINIDSYFNKNGRTYQALPEYAASKQSLIPWLKVFSIKFKIINLQLEHLYGPGDTTEKFVSKLIHELRLNRDIPLTPGDQTRDFIYVDDASRAILHVIDNEEIIKSSPNYAEYSIGTGRKTTIRDFALSVKKILQSDSNLNFGAIPYREDEIQDSHSDGNFQQAYEWAPLLDLEQNLVKWLGKE